jgi:ribosome biogenesis protein MAK21
MHDTVAFVKLQALAIVFKLLAGNAEQEQNLLRLGVNKLVSKTDYTSNWYCG